MGYICGQGKAIAIGALQGAAGSSGEGGDECCCDDPWFVAPSGQWVADLRAGNSDLGGT